MFLLPRGVQSYFRYNLLPFGNFCRNLIHYLKTLRGSRWIGVCTKMLCTSLSCFCFGFISSAARRLLGEAIVPNDVTANHITRHYNLEQCVNSINDATYRDTLSSCHFFRALLPSRGSDGKKGSAIRRIGGSVSR